MSTIRRLTLSSITLLTLATTVGCGRSLTTPAALPAANQGPQAFTAGGEPRAMGYNAERYQRELAAKAHPVHLTRAGKLPAAVDNRQYCPRVYDQSALGSCTAFSMGKGLREYMQRKNGERQVPLSALWLYYEERVALNTVNEDSGANMVDGMNVLANQGNATDDSWPYTIADFKIKPPATAYATAADWKIKEKTELASFDDVKIALANGQAVAFGFIVYLRFQFIGKSGVMPMPFPLEPKMGGHAVLAVGYDDAKQQLIVRNSWGSGWGDNGYFYMPYKFAQDKKRAMEWFTAK